MNRNLLLRRHYENFWGGAMTKCEFARGPVHQLAPEFSVLRLGPHGSRRMWTYATAGMSDGTYENGIELHMFSPTSSDEVVELLFATAHFHRTEKILGLGHTVNFGRGWIDSSACDHGLISHPYLDGESLENFSCDGGSVKCYWLVPLTKS